MKMVAFPDTRHQFDLNLELVNLNELLFPCIEGLEMFISIFGGLPLLCGFKIVPQECVPGLSNFNFLVLITLAFNTLKLLLSLGGKFWPKFIMCVIYFYPHAMSPKFCNI